MDITSRLNKHVCKVCANSTLGYRTSVIILPTLNKVSPSRLLGSKLQGVFPLLSEWQPGVHQPQTKTWISMVSDCWRNQGIYSISHPCYQQCPLSKALGGPPSSGQAWIKMYPRCLGASTTFRGKHGIMRQPEHYGKGLKVWTPPGLRETATWFWPRHRSKVWNGKNCFKLRGEKRQRL